MEIEIKEVTTKSDLKKFALFYHQLYKGNKFAAPNLLIDELSVLSSEKNPAFKFCKTKILLAYKNGKIVGRIVGIINSRFEKEYNIKQVRFGWFDFIDDYSVSEALIKSIEDWAKENNVIEIHGPLGFTDFDPEGMLIFGFDKPGTMATIFNYSYYMDHIKRLGYDIAAEWIEFSIVVPEKVPEKFVQAAGVISERYNLRLPEFKSKKEFADRYGRKIFEMFNKSYSTLYGFTTLTDEQIDFYVKTYITILNLDLIVLVVDDNDDVIGCGISFPSLTLALQKAKGKLFPFGFIHLLKALKKNNIVDLYLIAVRPDFMGKGINALMFKELIPKFVKHGFKFAETNANLIDNFKVLSQWDSFEKSLVKKRAAFKKKI